MKTYKEFIFEGYDFDSETKTLNLNYSFDGEFHFIEKLQFQFDFLPEIDQQLLDNALFGLFVTAGVSYYKAYAAPRIRFKGRGLTKFQAEFFSKLYRQGLGEFLVRNQLSPDKLASFEPDERATSHAVEVATSGVLVPIGGGKDSLVTVETLKQSDLDLTTWTVGHADQLQPLIKKIGLPHFQVERTLAPELLKVNGEDAYNGHIPISAYFAFLATLTGVLTRKQDIVLSNEASAGEGNLDYEGIQVNHQYSKTMEFEQDFQEYLKQEVSPSIRYFSFLRPLSELRISEVFSKRWLDQYVGYFSSCNRNFVLGHGPGMSWCGECPKCAFTYLILAPFMPKSKLMQVFGDRNLFESPKLERTYRELLGIEGHKPFDCVGEIRECRQAVVMARATGEYPELNQFEFPPFKYDYQELREHRMPEEYYQKLTRSLDRSL